MGRRMGKKGGCHRLRVTRRTFNFPVGFSKTSSGLRERSTTIEGVATKPEDERLRETERTRGDEGGGGEVGDREQSKSKARYSTENNIRADDDDRI